jgi:hypothetical protein
MKKTSKKTSKNILKKKGGVFTTAYEENSLKNSEFIQENIKISDSYVKDTLFTTITEILNKKATEPKNIEKIMVLLNRLNTEKPTTVKDDIINSIKDISESDKEKMLKINSANDNFFDDIANIVLRSEIVEEEKKDEIKKINEDIEELGKSKVELEQIQINDEKRKIGNGPVRFNTHIYDIITSEIKDGVEKFSISKSDIFGKYKLFIVEDLRTFITIDPTIIQIMKFDEDDVDDVVYSLKLIIRSKNLITLRYTNKLFPENSTITDFKDISKFNELNKRFDDVYYKNSNYDQQLHKFFKKYNKFYKYYKKCYVIKFDKNLRLKSEQIKETKLTNYQLKYISILGKARFTKQEIINEVYNLSDFVMSNLLFTNPEYGFISGGYKGFKQNAYGITRSGYEIAKQYNRPILTIMCKEGMHDAHEYSDATLIYGEHWGEDTIALSQLTDGAIVIAPFGGWTYIECLSLLATKKIVGIYNNMFNILNNKHYETGNKDDVYRTNELIDTKINNFKKFNRTEQENIINYYINYYLILMHISYIGSGSDKSKEQELDTYNEKYGKLDKDIEDNITENEAFFIYLVLGIKLLTYLKHGLKNLDNSKLIEIILNFELIKDQINNYIDKYLNTHINNSYNHYCTNCDDYKCDNYQREIPEKCDGIWIKPTFDLIEKCIIIKASFTGGNHHDHINKINNTNKKINIKTEIDKIGINYKKLKSHKLFKNLNTNIIFVFTNIMYLNIYINQNLESLSFQEKLIKKIGEISNATYAQSSDDTMRYIELDKNLDGYYDPSRGTIDLGKIKTDNYTFIINENCNNYVSLLEDETKSVAKLVRTRAIHPSKKRGEEEEVEEEDE